jgi:hypothetical protein
MGDQARAQEVPSMTDKCKRGIKPSVPFGYEALLTQDQRHVIDRCRGFGWELHFIRRPLFSDPVVVMIDASDHQHWLIHDNGEREPFNELRAA